MNDKPAEENDTFLFTEFSVDPDEIRERWVELSTGAVEFNPEEHKDKKYIVEVLNEETGTWDGYRLEKTEMGEPVNGVYRPQLVLSDKIYSRKTNQKSEIVDVSVFHNQGRKE